MRSEESTVTATTVQKNSTLHRKVQHVASKENKFKTLEHIIIYCFIIFNGSSTLNTVIYKSKVCLSIAYYI